MSVLRISYPRVRQVLCRVRPGVDLGEARKIVAGVVASLVGVIVGNLLSLLLSVWGRRTRKTDERHSQRLALVWRL